MSGDGVHKNLAVRIPFLLTSLAMFAGFPSASALAGEPLHEAIDRLIAAGTPAYDQVAAPLAADDEFLRRVMLDLTGTIPTAEEARRFLDDPDPGKRGRAAAAARDPPRYVAESG